jgi:hypothetical protein
MTENVARIIRELEFTNDRITRAITELRALDSPAAAQPVRKRGRPKKALLEKVEVVELASNQPRQRHISAAGRRNIAEATRKRWADWRAQQASQARKSAKR